MGRCKSFDAAGDGYGRGEGFNALVLQQCAAAHQQHGKGLVLALAQGSAVNQDGRSSSLTAPNGPAQQVWHAGLLPKEEWLVCVAAGPVKLQCGCRRCWALR